MDNQSSTSSSYFSHDFQDSIEAPTNFPLDEQIAFHETMLESLQKRMMAIQDEIQSERERLKGHQERMIQLEERERYLKRARDENVVLLKGVTQTLDKCIQKYKRGMKMMMNKENREGGEEMGRGEKSDQKLEHEGNDDDESLVVVAADVQDGETPNHIVTLTAATDNGDYQDENNYFHQGKGDDHQIETTEVDAKHLVDDELPTALTPIPKDKSSQSSKLSLHPPKIETVRISSSSVFHEEYMKKRWGQSDPHDNSIFRLSRNEQQSMLPLHHPLTSVDMIERMMMISQRENMARRRSVVGYMSSCDDKRDTTGNCIQKDYDYIVKGTILDIHGSSQYDPHFFEPLMEKSMESERLKDPITTNSNMTISTSTLPSRMEINPNKIICRKALFGKCNNAFCIYQHLSGRSNLKTKSNKLRTIETYQHPPEVVLPIRSFPFPPPPTTITIDASVVDTPQKCQVDVERYECMDKTHDNNESQPGRIDHGDLLSDHHSSELMEQRKKRRIDMMLYNRLEEEIEGSQQEEEDGSLSMGGHASSNEKDGVLVSKGPMRGCGGEVVCRSVCHEIDNQSNMSSNSSDSEKQRSKGHNMSYREEEVCGSACEEGSSSNMSLNSSDSEKEEYDSKLPSRRINNVADENYIELPTLDSAIDEAQVSSAIHNILSESDNNFLEEDCPPLHNLVKDTMVTSNDKHQNLSSIYEALASLGFLVTSEYIDGKTSHLINYKCPLAFLPDLPGVMFEDVFGQTLLLNSIVSGVQLCIHAGRVDLSQGILDFGSDGNFSEDSPVPPVLKESHLFIVQLVMDTLSRLSEGSTCGRGTQCPNSIYHIQLFLATVSHFTQDYLEALTSQNFDNMDELEVYVTDFANNLQITVQTLFHDIAPATSANQKFPVIFTDLEASLNVMSNLTEAETCRKLSDFAVLGQRVARVAAYTVLEADDPQLVIENILFTFVTSLKLCSNGRLLDIPCRKTNILSNTYWSSKSPKQVAIFNLFGPGIFTSISGIIYLMTKEKSRSGIFCSRHEGILVQLKQLLMQSIQYLDYSGIISNNIEGQLLLCPFFGMLANVLVASHSYTLTHVLLVNALYEAHRAKNWAVYSDLLWSQLLQLHASFPPAISEDMMLISDLVKLPIDYGIYPSKFTLQGDNALVNLMRSEESSVHEKCLEQMDQISSLCMKLSLFQCETEGSVEHNLTSITINIEGKNASPHSASFFGEFPMSFCLIGSNLVSIHLQNCRLASIPVTFGDWFPHLEVSNLRYYHKHLKMSHYISTF